METYIHKTRSRLRIRSSFIHQHPELIADSVVQLRNLEAITDIRHRAHAGSVTLSFDPDCLSADELLAILEAQDWCQQDSSDGLSVAVSQGVRKVARHGMILAMERVLGQGVVSLIGRAL
ncbi:hypothetical protein [Ferrimonas pelagia]|uniref:Heavy-metal-associated domain-containing protein n=1 Tax=Ferrimonas pelagia TaxID=1177826 RepID=A0ABP9F4F2_9GAMM